MARNILNLVIVAACLPSLALGQSLVLVVPDPVDGHPVLINGGLGDMEHDGLEPAILVSEGMVSDMYIAPGMVRLTAQSFNKTGKYHVKLFSHYHRDAFCEFSASKQLKPEYLSACRSVGYRVCDFSVDTRERKFQIGVPWSCTFLGINGQPLFGIEKPGFLSRGWVSFDSLAKTDDREFLKIIDSITATVRKIVESTN